MKIAAEIIQQGYERKGSLLQLLATLKIRERRMFNDIERIRIGGDLKTLNRFENSLTRVQTEIRRTEDSINNLEMTRKKYNQLKQKLTGEFLIHPDIGIVDDDESIESI